MLNNILIEKALKKEFVLIAEIGVNYYDIALDRGISLIEAAKLMIREANEAGVHAVKFQSYKADTLASKKSPAYWDLNEEATNSQYELFKKFDSFSFEEYKELSSYCKEVGIEFLSTAFDLDSADYLNSLMNVYKISSSDLNNIPFVEYQAKKNKPIILSIGASNEDEIENTVKAIRKFNNQPIALLHCVLEYPTPYEHANLSKIKTLSEKYPDLIIGYSDHTKPDKNYDVIKTAYNFGAVIVEKHFTLNKALKGNDHYHSMDADDAKEIIENIKFVDALKGRPELQYLKSEENARLNARRSLVSATKIIKGEVITQKMLTFKRPGLGISPDQMQEIIGRKAIIDIEEDTVIEYNMLSDNN